MDDHQRYLRKWQEIEKLTFSFTELWAIRERGVLRIFRKEVQLISRWPWAD